MTEWTVRLAAFDNDILDLPRVQVSAGSLFREIGMAPVADGPEPLLEDFATAMASGDLLIATASTGVVGFVRTKPLDGALHVEQISVAPSRQGCGIGSALMDAAERSAVERGFDRMTLTTFRDVPFNGPFYRRLGWTVVEEPGLTRGLRAERQIEATAGLDRWPRVAMEKALR